MNSEQYLKDRVDNQINWYDNKAVKYKRLDQYISTFAIFSTSLIPLLSLLPYISNIDNNLLTFITCLLGIITAMLLSFSKIFKFADLHNIYRLTCEKLKQEKYLYLSEADIYSKNKTSYPLFVSRVESILTTEVGNWSQLNEKREP